jgi:hypothetical protein
VTSLPLMALAWLVLPVAAVIGALAAWTHGPVAVLLWLPLAILPPAAWAVGRAHRAGPGAAWGAAARSGAALLLAAAATYLLLRYWYFYHLDAPLTGLLALAVVLPALYVAGAAIGEWAAWNAGRRGATTLGQLVVGVAAAGLLAVSVVTMVIVTSGDARGAEGEGAGDLRPFAAALIAGTDP